MDSRERNVLFTFDYELFLGRRSGSVENCCIKPTNALMNVFDEFSMKHAIFFVDTTFLARLKDNPDPRAADDYKRISEQLRQLVTKGHYVFPHIHPHWLDADYITDIHQWDLSDTKKYRFNTLNAAEKETVFKRSMEILNEIILPVCPAYSIDSYRAGGWCIQPFSDFQPFFDQHQILNDFSVLRGKSNTSQLQYYDFTTAPAEEIYTFENDPLRMNANGKYREYVISVLNIPKGNELLNKFLLKALWHLKQRNMGDGIGSADAGSPNSDPVKKELTEMVSVELLTNIRLPLYLEHLQKNNYMHFISHPKMISNYNMMVFKRFLTKFTKHYKPVTDYKAMSPFLNSAR